nr:MAG TPA: hypothetical protein [Caudoviricetes sp.]
MAHFFFRPEPLRAPPQDLFDDSFNSLITLKIWLYEK